MKVAGLFLALAALLACASDQYVEKKKLDEAQKQLEETRKDLAAAQKELSELKSHKYEFRTIGPRTFRFDTVTGKSCIQLTSTSDWKNPETKQQSCSCEDALEAPKRIQPLIDYNCGY